MNKSIFPLFIYTGIFFALHNRIHNCNSLKRPEMNY